MADYVHLADRVREYRSNSDRLEQYAITARTQAVRREGRRAEVGAARTQPEEGREAIAEKGTETLGNEGSKESQVGESFVSGVG